MVESDRPEDWIPCPACSGTGKRTVKIRYARDPESLLLLCYYCSPAGRGGLVRRTKVLKDKIKGIL